MVAAGEVVDLRDGLYLHPRHNWFLSSAHDDDVIDKALAATAAAFEEIAAPLTEFASPSTEKETPT
jgi:hypothetical protein